MHQLNEDVYMDENAKIIIEFTSQFPKLFESYNKYIPFINHNLSIETNNKFYIEPIQNGIIYFYEDFNTFLLMNQPYEPDFIKKFERERKLDIDPILFTENVITSINFPKEGVFFRYRIFSSRKDEIGQIIKDHFKSFLYDNLSILELKGYDLVLVMKNIEAISLYTELVSSMYSGILRYKPS